MTLKIHFQKSILWVTKFPNLGIIGNSQIPNNILIGCIAVNSAEGRFRVKEGINLGVCKFCGLISLKGAFALDLFNLS